MSRYSSTCSKRLLNYIMKVRLKMFENTNPIKTNNISWVRRSVQNAIPMSHFETVRKHLKANDIKFRIHFRGKTRPGKRDTLKAHANAFAVYLK